MSSNISNEQLNAMLKTASKKLGISPDNLRAALSNPEKADSVLSQIDKNSGGKFNTSDTKSLERMIMNNPKARKMFEDLARGKKSEK